MYINFYIEKLIYIFDCVNFIKKLEIVIKVCYT